MLMATSHQLRQSRPTCRDRSPRGREAHRWEEAVWCSSGELALSSVRSSKPGPVTCHPCELGPGVHPLEALVNGGHQSVCFVCCWEMN